MIIRMNLYKTLKASTLNRSTSGRFDTSKKESSICTQLGHSSRVLSAMAICPQVLRTLRLLDKPSEQVRVLSGDAFSVLCG